MNNWLGPIELKLLSWTQNKSISIVKTGDLINALRLTPQQEARLLALMSKKRLIAQVKRGLYLVPTTIPAGGVYTPSPYVVVDTLMSDTKATGYQISGLTVFNSYGFDTQISNQLDVYNDKISGLKIIAGQKYRFIKVRPDRLGFTQNYQVKEREAALTIQFSSPARALFDAIYDYEKYGTMPKAYDWLKTRANDKGFMREFLDVLRKLANVSVLKRVGYVLEGTQCSKNILAAIQAMIPKKRDFVPFDPTKVARGKSNLVWGLIVNG